MDTSLFLAKIMGPFLVLAALGFLCNMKKIEKMFDEVIKNPAALYLMGLLVFLLGLLIVLSHNVWNGDWTVIITLLGWIIMAKGVFLTLFPRAVSRTWKTLEHSVFYTIGGVIDLLLGLYLCYIGFTM